MDSEDLIGRLRRGSGVARGLDIEGQVSRLLDRRLQSLFGDAQRFAQVVEVLEGGRGDPLQAAARIGHLATLPAMMNGEPESREAAAAPTMGEFNALVRDVHSVFAAVNALRALLEA